jgi:hypothetical protein
MTMRDDPRYAPERNHDDEGNMGQQARIQDFKAEREVRREIARRRARGPVLAIHQGGPGAPEPERPRAFTGSETVAELKRIGRNYMRCTEQDRRLLASLSDDLAGPEGDEP